MSSSFLSLLWNGRRLPSFSPTRGLRQEDRISPYLFVLCMKKLSIAIREAVQDGRWKPVRVSKNGRPFSHLLFADDVLLFAKATSAQTRLIKDLFSSFSVHSGLWVNLEKSRAFYSSGFLGGKFISWLPFPLSVPLLLWQNIYGSIF